MAISRFKTLSVKNKVEKTNRLWDSQTQASCVTSNLTLYADASSGYSLRENLVTYSEQLDNGAWYKESSVNVSANATTNPFGASTADKLIEATNNGSHRFYQGTPVTSNILYTFSIYLKAAERTKALVLIQDTTGNQYGMGVDLNLGTFFEYSIARPYASRIESLSNGWYRVSITQYSGGTSSNIYGIPYILNDSGSAFYTGNGTSGIFGWGAQMERAAAVGNYNLTTGSVLDKTVPPVFYDISGNNNNFTLYGSVGYSPSNGGYLTFNQSNQYGVSSANAIGTAANSAFTMEAFAMTSTGVSWQTVFGTMTGYKQIGFLATSFNAGVNGGGGGLVPGGSTVVAGGWYHLAMTTSGNSLANFYLNGYLVKENINIGTNGNTNGVQTLASYNTSAGEMLNGRIGLVRAYNRQLSSTEITKNFNADRGRFGL